MKKCPDALLLLRTHLVIYKHIILELLDWWHEFLHALPPVKHLVVQVVDDS
jgi:hypothetical protein